VTVVARSAPGLPTEERLDGVTVIRVEQPKALRHLPSPGLPDATNGTATGGALRARVRDTVGRVVQGVRYLLVARAWARAIAARVPRADIWQSEGLITLPVALALRGGLGGRVVYDSRDLHLMSGRFARLPGLWRRLLARRERAWARSADAVLTANRPYADALQRIVGARPVVIFNGPVSVVPEAARTRRFHELFRLDPATRVALSLGAVVPHRGIEEACVAIGAVPDAVLVVVGDGASKATLESTARSLVHADRIHFLPAVPPQDIPAWTAAADVAVMPIQPSTINHRLTTPTRLFDALGAGVPVVASDLPGMAEIVRETGCGVLCNPSDPADIARGIRAILDAPADRRSALRAACLAAAGGEYAWARQVEKLVAVYAGLGLLVERPAAGFSRTTSKKSRARSERG
ncbi:MAG TPA: glycosyltransferase family 4 protein, partial [Candidatus Limnocylindrales bacterium]